MMKFKVFLLLAVMGYGYSRTGISGALICLFLLGFAAFLYYTIWDAGNSVANLLRPKSQTTNVYPTTVYKDGLKGQSDQYPDVDGTARRNPDPTGPDDFDEFAGMITTRIERNRHGY